MVFEVVLSRAIESCCSRPDSSRRVLGGEPRNLRLRDEVFAESDRTDG